MGAVIRWRGSRPWLTDRRRAGARGGAAATRLLLGLGLVGGIWVVSVGDAAAGPLDGVVPAPKVPKVTLSVTTPSVPSLGALTDPLPLPLPPPAATVAAPPPAPAPAPFTPAAVAPGAVPALDAATVGEAPPAAAPVAANATSAVERGRLERAPTGLRAVLDTARSSTALFLFAGAAALFLLVQGRLDRRSPRLAHAPVDRRAEMLEFS